MLWNWLKKSNNRTIAGRLLIYFYIFVFLFSSWNNALLANTQNYNGDSVLDLNEKMRENQEKLKELRKQADVYRKRVRETQKKAVTLQNQINILDASINETEIDIQTKVLEIKQLELELELVSEKIKQESARIEDIKLKTAEILRKVNHYDNQGYFIILVTQNSLSQLFDELHRSEVLNINLFNQLQTLKQIKESLEGSQGLLDNKRQEAVNAKNQLDESKITLEEEKGLKERLFGETKASEEEFQKLLNELRTQEAAIDSEIITIEKEIRKKLQIADSLAGGNGKLSWPINPSRGITSYFHDPDYPFRYIFEHSGIDIRASQGTPVVAAASGYVAKVFNGGMGNKPSYIMILHSDGLTTVYMHLSSLNVLTDTYVARGQIIGASGGAPGTSGAGRWTTGPHLHFEVRLNGIPIDPLSYLP